MIFVDNETHSGDHHDPRINLAIEEHLLRNVKVDEDILLFYINGPSIIIGRNQNTLEEINLQYVEDHNIIVVRRLSGGGAVYHDLGNLNFSLISNSGKENLHNFKKFTQPVINVLNAMGVPAELSGRNDILVEGKKISGNAQYSIGTRMASHGTLLYDSDLSQVAEALNVKITKMNSKGIKSVRSRVANISEFMDQKTDIYTFRERVKEGILASSANSEYFLTEADWEEIARISNNRYMTWEWNFGRSPEFNVQKTFRFPIGEIDARIDVEEGLIKGIKIYGDFLGLSDVSEIEHRLVGSKYERESMQRALDGVDLQRYFGDLQSEDLVQFLYN